MTEPTLPEDDAMLFFREVVEPTVDEFMVDRASKRRGCLACLALASMAEHYFHARPNLPLGKLAEFKPAIRTENKAVSWIADVANATRHVHRRDKPSRIGYGDMQPLETGQVGVLRAGWPIGGEEVLVGHDHEWRLSTLIETTMTFWRAKLHLPSETHRQEEN